jgi:hypothetical protein
LLEAGKVAALQVLLNQLLEVHRNLLALRDIERSNP